MANENEDIPEVVVEQQPHASGLDVALLKQQRSTMKRNISNIKAKIEKEGDKVDTTILECRLEILESYFKQLSHIQGQIEKLYPKDTARSDLEELFISAKTLLMSLLKGRRGSNYQETTMCLNQTLSSGLLQHNRLPFLKLPKFDGKYADYKRFIRTFSNLVHDDNTIPAVDKFNYLLNCLSGPALAVIEPFQVTEENYPKALARLKDRYDNDVLIFLDYINALFEIPGMTRADPVSLRSIIDTVSALRGSLLSLGSEVDVMNSILIHMVLSKVDNESKSTYNEKIELVKLPSWEDCYTIFNRRCQFLESSSSSKSMERNEKRETNPRPKSKYNRSSHSYVNAKANCAFCQNAEHSLGNCSSFLSLPVSQRFDFVKKSALCINCMRKGHTVSKCQSQSRCKVCNFSHHTHLHLYARPAQSLNVDTPNLSSPSPSTSQQHQSALPHIPVSLITRSYKTSIIPTALILIKDKFGLFQPVRALLDSCSELNFITEEAAKRLQLKWIHNNQEVSGISDIRTNLKHSVFATIKSRVCEFEWSANFSITKAISSEQPGENIDTATWKIPEGIQLADPHFFIPQRVDLLLSIEVFFNLLLGGKISLGEGLPCLVNTVFGWIVGGKLDIETKSRPLTCNLLISSHCSDLDSILQRFWEIEELKEPSVTYSEEELKCEEHFLENVVVQDDGRLQVRLPFKESPAALGKSFESARRRFISLERRLERDQILKKMYVDFMDEYLALGHMVEVQNVEFSKPHYFIPHHCVLRPQSSTTKLRVVFDASARTSSNRSLNEILMVGPTIQQDLITTLLSFRLHKCALTADISKMYRQFWLDERDQTFQLIVWRKNIEEQLKIFQLKTVTYGMSAAPFLAIRSLFHIADIHHNTFPIGSSVLREDLYVDDVLTGADNLDDLQRKRREVTELLELHGLKLAKWNCNCPRLLSETLREDETIINDSTEDSTKALGMSWKPNKDLFCFQYTLPEVQIVTKRSILSVIARIFDLLGLLSPIIIRCKILMQEMWIQKIAWDEPLPENLSNLWLQLKDDLNNIHHLEVPRYVLTSSNNSCEIHGFADASQRAYGCCIYVRTRQNNSYKTNLLFAKSKVAPIKAQSLSRLELCAALLLSRAWQKIKHKLSKFTQKIYFWTDSKIVLQWLKMHSSTLTCFVANRVSEIQNKTQGIAWRHVPSKSNPADIVSRGCSVAELSSSIWFSGPKYLEQDQSEWPTDNNVSDVGNSDLERRKAVSFKCSNSGNEGIINSIVNNNSSYYRILRIVSYIYRIFNKVPVDASLRAHKIINVPHRELDNTFWKIIAGIQEVYYKAEIDCLRHNKAIKSSIQSLSPFLQQVQLDNSEFCLIRVGGRLSNAPIPYDARFPALLPKEHRFTTLFIEFLHRKHLHAGPKVLISLLRQKLWVVNARELVRKVVRNCVHCFHYKPQLMGQIMGNLPADRLKGQRPFLITGVDFCGPFFTSYRIRGKPPYKTYLAIFVCFASKAIHVELVSDLSTNNFLLCLRRFIGRRGIPLRLYCDNAKNFVGAQSKLNEFHQRFFNQPEVDEMMMLSSKIGFEFSFIPPRAPHFGGLWEAAVKSTKTLLMKNIAHANLTYEELHTVVVEVEAILNSRPLAPMSNDPNDGEALTPAHLLIGTSLMAIPDERFDCNKPSYLTRWQQITFLKQRFWELWSRDYILTLQQRSKWSKPETNIKVGQMVIVHEDNIPPQQWMLARITQAIPGADGRVRVVDLQTSKGTFRRPIHKLAPLPTSEKV